jgi:hypothetical protein
MKQALLPLRRSHALLYDNRIRSFCDVVRIIFIDSYGARGEKHHASFKPAPRSDRIFSALGVSS